MKRWQFSLRSLFIVMTVLAALTAFAANYPSVALACLLLTAPFFMGRMMAYLFINAPRTTRVIMLLLGTAFLFTCAYLSRRAYRHHDFDEWGAWFTLALLFGFALLSYWVAWVIPGKAPQNGSPSRNDLTP